MILQSSSVKAREVSECVTDETVAGAGVVTRSGTPNNSVPSGMTTRKRGHEHTNGITNVLLENSLS